MKQLIMDGPKKSHVIDVDIPKIGDNQLLVKVLYSGLCHSEWYPWSVAECGQTFGHETMGVVADKGANVKNFKIGDRVTGLGGGGHKEYIVMEPEKTFVVPDNISDKDAIGEPLGCLMSISERVDSNRTGDTIVIVGAGYMGLGLISLFKAKGYLNVIAIDEREIALKNAKRYGADEVYLSSQLPSTFKLNWETWKSPDLKRDGHLVDIFNIGFQNVVEITGTQTGLNLAGEMVCAHGNLGIAGFHNYALRTVDFKLWGMKAMTMYNCHERRISYEATLVKKALDMISKDIWKFRDTVTHLYDLSEFDMANYDMKNHTDNYIKGAISFV